jgi:hypothetical protein
MRRGVNVALPPRLSAIEMLITASQLKVTLPVVARETGEKTS